MKSIPTRVPGRVSSTNKQPTNTMKSKLITSSVALLAAMSLPATAATLAFDSAANAAYDTGWQTGSNGGTGFTAWTFNNPGDTFFYTGQSSGNADQTPSPTNTDIDTPATAIGRSFGISAGSGASASASRDFTGGALSIGQTFSFDFDNGYIAAGSPVGVSLLTGTTSRYTFQFQGGNSNYTVNGTDTGLGFSGDGLRVSVTLTGTDTFSTSVTRLAGGTPPSFVGTGSLMGTGALTGFSFFNNNAGFGQDNNQFINNVAVVPEPTSFAMLALGGLLIARRRRK